MTGDGLVLRPATVADFQAMEAIYAANEPPEPGDPPAPAGWMTRYLDHILARGDMLIAENDSGPVGFAGVVDIGRAVHVADLFVDPGSHGVGVGRRLLRLALGERWPRMTYSSDDPRAMPLYIKAGMLPRWPNIYLDSEGRVVPEVASVRSALAVRAVSAVEAAEIEIAFGGANRQPDYEHWAAQPGGQSFVVERDGRAVGVGSSRDRWRKAGRWISRLILDRTASDVVTPVLAALDFAGRGQPISLAVAGPHPVVPALINGGFRMFDRDTFMASEDGLLDPLHHIVDPGVP